MIYLPHTNIARHRASLAFALLACWAATSVHAAEPPRHYLNAGAMPPGAVGSTQLMRGGPLPGYFQPIEIRASEGGQVAYAMENAFGDSQAMPAKAGMLIGSVYRLRITGLPRHEGEELYPTIEVINRLYPPVGQELRFPIPIELAREDIEAAFQGKFVTRIIYLENPRGAYPRAEDPKWQHTLEVAAHEDPLVVADRLGRPMAILPLAVERQMIRRTQARRFCTTPLPCSAFARHQNYCLRQSDAVPTTFRQNLAFRWPETSHDATTHEKNDIDSTFRPVAAGLFLP